MVSLACTTECSSSLDDSMLPGYQPTLAGATSGSESTSQPRLVRALEDKFLTFTQVRVATLVATLRTLASEYQLWVTSKRRQCSQSCVQPDLTSPNPGLVKTCKWKALEK